MDSGNREGKHKKTDGRPEVYVLIANPKCNPSYNNCKLVDDFAVYPRISGEGQEDSGEHKKSRSITFRLDFKVIDELQHEADQGQISLNVLVNHKEIF